MARGNLGDLFIFGAFLSGFGAGDNQLAAQLRQLLIGNGAPGLAAFRLFAVGSEKIIVLAKLGDSLFGIRTCARISSMRSAGQVEARLAAS